MSDLLLSMSWQNIKVPVLEERRSDPFNWQEIGGRLKEVELLKDLNQLLN
jgi:hypothetical protein